MPLLSQSGERVLPPALERAALDRPARVAHEVDEAAQIMQAEEADAEDLLLVHEVPDVRATEAPTGRAAAMLVERARVTLETCVPEVEPPLPGQRASRPRRPRPDLGAAQVPASSPALGIPAGIAAPR